MARNAFQNLVSHSPWGPPQVDTFPNVSTKQVFLVFSPCPDPDTKGLDVLATDWPNEVLYAFQPFINKVMEKVQMAAPFNCNRSGQSGVTLVPEPKDWSGNSFVLTTSIEGPITPASLELRLSESTAAQTIGFVLIPPK